MLNRDFFKIELVKNFSKHFTGTFGSALISFALMPVFTRLFSPEEFGLYYLYLSIVGTLPTLATGRYEHALMLPSSDNNAANILVGSLTISFIFCALLFGVCLVYGDQIGALLNNTALIKWFPLCIAATFLISFNQLVSYWIVRKKDFLGSSKNKIVQSGGTSLATFGLGSAKLFNGLIVGDFIGKCLLFIFGMYQLKKNNFGGVKRSLIGNDLIKYKDFPLYNAVPSVLDKFSLNMPVVIISSFFSASINGFVNLPKQILGTPLSLISASISQVYFQNIIEKKNLNQLIVPQLLKAIKFLSLIAVVFVIGTLLCSEIVFEVVFGEEWKIAGYYAKILSFAIAIKFVVSPLSIVFPSLNKMKIGSFWQVLYFIAICTLFFLESFSIEYFLIIYVIIELLMYSFYLFLIVKVAKEHDRNLS
ncbi:MAG: O-antigen/teichoic acid export membrane protein [Saprospiraceae bacterium]|jgi:O-antigen/teichoic acid export membrane protein